LEYLLFGDSGAGKSAALRNCPLDKWGLVNVMGKPLPFKNSFKSIQTNDTDRIVQILQTATASSIVVDDTDYLISGYYMENKAPLTAKMGDKYVVYDRLATRFWRLINSPQRRSSISLCTPRIMKTMKVTFRVTTRRMRWTRRRSLCKTKWEKSHFRNASGDVSPLAKE
jgi:hypothetical protein